MTLVRDSDSLLDAAINGAEFACSAGPLSVYQVQQLGADDAIDAQIIRNILIGKIVPASAPESGTWRSRTPRSGTWKTGTSAPPVGPASEASPPPLDPKGIRIRGAWIRGTLDLDGVTTKVGLWLTQCRLDAIQMRDANLTWIELDTCVLPTVIGDRGQFGRLAIRQCLVTDRCPDAAIRLANAHVTSELRFNGTCIQNSERPGWSRRASTSDPACSWTDSTEMARVVR